MANITDVMLMAHVGFGMMCIVTGLWVFVDTLNVNEANIARIRIISLVAAASMWLALLVGGYWYVFYYAGDKAFILKGPWPAAHNFFMEMKEHVVFMLVLLATFLPLAAAGNLASNKGARNLVLTVAGLIVVIGLAMDGSGAIIGMGAKLAMVPK
ncbi:MAG: hypothetical protein ABFD97_25655 [Syntrophobacter sp.]